MRDVCEKGTWATHHVRGVPPLVRADDDPRERLRILVDGWRDRLPPQGGVTLRLGANRAEEVEQRAEVAGRERALALAAGASGADEGDEASDPSARIARQDVPIAVLPHHAGCDLPRCATGSEDGRGRIAGEDERCEPEQEGVDGCGRQGSGVREGRVAVDEREEGGGGEERGEGADEGGHGGCEAWRVWQARSRETARKRTRRDLSI